MTAKLTEAELKNLNEGAHRIVESWEDNRLAAWEASDQRQYEAEMAAVRGEYERAMKEAAKSAGCCPECGRQVDYEGLYFWCEELT